MRWPNWLYSTAEEHRIIDIGNDQDGAEQAQHGIQEFQVIAFDHFPHFLPGACFQHYIVPSFRYSHENGQQEGHDGKPVAQVYPCQHRSTFHAQHKAGSHDDHIEDAHILQTKTVTDIQHIIEGR